MSVRRSAALLAIAALGLAAAACETTGAGGYYGPPPPASSAFNRSEFAWSQGMGSGSIEGNIAYRNDGRPFDCTGSVALTPDTPYTRARFRTLYGSVDRAAVPEAVVRARTVADPNADYRSFVRSTTCQGGRFAFDNLPDGGWYIIVPVSAGGDERIVLMRFVVTRGGRLSVTL